jgi:hypothetical protein
MRFSSKYGVMQAAASIIHNLLQEAVHVRTTLLVQQQ